jgi:hypothetical protein
MTIRGVVTLSTALTLGAKWFETPAASPHHGTLRFPYDPEALGLLRL